MSFYSALIRFAPLLTLERLNDPAWTRVGRTLYESGALRFLPGVTSVPLLVNHDEDAVIGTVDKLFRLEWTDGPWIAASATVTAEPDWLKTGAKASYGHRTLRHLDLAGTSADVIALALVDEVSILSPGVQPKEPRAEVVSLTRTTATRSTSGAGEEIVHPPGGDRVRRYYDVAPAVVL